MPSAIFVIRHPVSGKLLVETRPQSDSYFPGGTIYPGGKFHEGETPYDAFIRELKEEIGIYPMRTYYLSTAMHHPEFADPIYYGDIKTEAFQVFPFLVTSYAGEAPPAVLDTGHPLSWLTLDEASQLDAGCTVEITRRARLLLDPTKLVAGGNLFPPPSRLYYPNGRPTRAGYLS